MPPEDKDSHSNPMIGRQLGSYRIEALLGSGGGGEVYRATDTRLRRPVAIKLLQRELMADQKRRRRFTQEARAASALNHPNIVHIYDIAEQDGMLYLVMEYVPGQTLKEAIGRSGSGLSFEQVLRYGQQLADALSAAHAVNLVHRDVKPANLIVGPQDLLKLVDFGIAKVEMADAASATTTSHDESTRSETRSDIDLTRPGTVMGTAPYMSPEQVRGSAAGPASDVFALGVVLYEMTTGQRAFTGPNALAIVSHVVSSNPRPVEEARPDAPQGLCRLINACLAKEPAARPTSAAVSNELARLLKNQEQGLLPAAETTRVAARVSEPPLPPKPAATRRVGVVAAAAALVAGGGWFALSTRNRTRDSQPGQQPTLTRLTSDAGLTTDGALSLDGQWLAFSSNRAEEGNLDIWVRRVAGGAESRRLTTDPAAETDPAFSSDGRWIAFRSERDGGGVEIVPSAGDKPPRRIAKSARSPRYSPDGKWIAGWVGERQSDSAIVLALADGSAPPRELKLDPPLRVARFPVWSSSGEHLLFLGQADDHSYDWWVASVADGKARPTGAFKAMRDAHVLVSYQTAPGDWTAANDVYFTGHAASDKDPTSAREYDLSVSNFDSTNLWKLRVDPATARADGAPARLTVGAAIQVKPSAGGGRVAFSNIDERINLWQLEVPVRGGAQAAASPRINAVIGDTASNTYPAISGDGRRVVYASNRGTSTDLWLRDLAAGTDRQLTFDRGDESGPTISADGSRVAYSIQFGDSTAVRTLDLDTGGNPGTQREVCRGCDYLSQISPDGTHVLVYQRPGEGGVSMFNVQTGQRTQLLKTARYAVDPQIAPGGQWLAFHTIDGRTDRRVWVAPLGRTPPIEEKDWIPVTDGKGMDRHPAWSADGATLYFHSEDDGWRCVWSRGFDPRTGTLSSTPAEPVAHFHSASRNMLHFPNAAMARLGVGKGRMVFSLYERRGNVWIADWTAKR